MNTTETTLTIGATLPSGAKFLRWDLTNGEETPSNFTDIVEGYHPDNYFRGGKYLGADEAGVEPVFEISKRAMEEAWDREIEADVSSGAMDKAFKKLNAETDDAS